MKKKKEEEKSEEEKNSCIHKYDVFHLLGTIFSDFSVNSIKKFNFKSRAHDSWLTFDQIDGSISNLLNCFLRSDFQVIDLKIIWSLAIYIEKEKKRNINADNKENEKK